MQGVAALGGFRRAVAEFSFTDLDVVFRSGGTGYGATGPGLVGFNDQLRRETPGDPRGPDPDPATS
jgi:hypothetical protein